MKAAEKGLKDSGFHVKRRTLSLFGKPLKANITV
jgi:hypothetical protein